ncbi:MAG: winged helix-turn-helix transcriptional regulator [Chloroflexota bacterium]|nr:winged helix-turn-helix transcriptional regulator [Chloroflexota bacterium]
MTTRDRTEAKKRSEMLADLRKQHREQVKEAQAMLKQQQGIRKSLRRALQAGPHSVPQLADQVGLSAPEVLWHVAAMKKYGQIVETGLDEDYEYYLYGLAKEEKR